MIHHFTRRGLELRFEADKGGAAGASSPATAAIPVEEKAKGEGLTAKVDAPEKLPEEFLRMIPGGEMLIEKKASSDEKPRVEGEKAEADSTPKLSTPQPPTPPEEDEVPESEADKPHVKKMLKRIDKLTAKLAGASEEREEIKAERDSLAKQLADAQTEKTPLRADNPLAGISSQAKLDEAVAHAENVRDWALKNWDGATIVGADKAEKELSASEVRDIFATHDAILRKHAPARAAWIQAAAQQTEKAVERFPWMNDTKSEQFALRQQVLANLPEMKRFPDFENFIGEWITGHLAMKAKPASEKPEEKKPAPPVKLAPTPPGVSSSLPAKVPDTKKSDEALRRLVANPSDPRALMEAVAA